MLLAMVVASVGAGALAWGAKSKLVCIRPSGIRRVAGKACGLVYEVEHRQEQLSCRHCRVAPAMRLL